MLIFAIPILTASVLLWPWTSFIAAGVCSAVILAISSAFLQRPLPDLPAIPAFFLLAFIAWLSARSLEQALERSRTSEERYRTVSETTGTATIIIEEDTTISLVNEEDERLSGYAKEEIEGKKRWTDVVAPEDQEGRRRYHRLRRRAPDQAPRQDELRFVDREGNVRDVLLTIDIIPGTSKSVASLLDITARKEMEEALQEARETRSPSSTGS